MGTLPYSSLYVATFNHGNALPVHTLDPQLPPIFRVPRLLREISQPILFATITLDSHASVLICKMGGYDARPFVVLRFRNNIA